MSYGLLTKFDVVAFKVEDFRSTENRHVLELGLSDCRAVVGNKHKFGLAVPQGSHGELVT